jgi:hypothetical protein
MVAPKNNPKIHVQLGNTIHHIPIPKTQLAIFKHRKKNARSKIRAGGQRQRQELLPAATIIVCAGRQLGNNVNQR